MWTIEPPSSSFSRFMSDLYGSMRGSQRALLAGVFTQSVVKKGTRYSWLTKISPSSSLFRSGNHAE